MSGRMRKVNSTLREVVAEAVDHYGFEDVGLLTITAMETAPNLKKARVFYSVLGSEADEARAKERLDSIAGQVSRYIGRNTRMKFTPTIAFERDRTSEVGTRIAEILRQSETGLSEEE